MIKGIKNHIISMLLIGMCSLCLTGCMDYSSEEVTNQEENNKTNISYSWWGNDGRHMYTMDGVDKFMELNPDINVNCKYSIWTGFERRNKVMMKSHTEADVMQINFGWLSNYSSDGNGYYDMYELSDVIDLSQFSEDDLRFGVINEKLNALPIAFNTPEIYYNKTLYDKYGLEYPKTWEDFITAARVMKKDRVYPLGVVKKHLLFMFVAYEEQRSGMSIISEDGKLNFNKLELSDMLMMYVRMLKEKVMIPVDSFERSEVYKGNIASVLCWVIDAEDYCGAMKDGGYEPEIYGHLVEENSKEYGWYVKPSTMYAISKYTTKPEEAGRLVEFLINSPDMARLQLDEKGVPVSKKALDTVLNTEDGMSGYVARAGEYMSEHIAEIKVMNPALEDGRIADAFKDAGDAYLYNKDILPNIIDKLNDTIVEVLKEYE